MSTVKVTELGCPGHFIGARACRWRRHTQIGKKYRVSSVGDYYPEHKSGRETLGAAPDSFFETMVFETLPRQVAQNEDCGCFEVKSFSEIDRKRYATAGEAQRGHEAMVRKYLKKAAPPDREEDGR